MDAQEIQRVKDALEIGYDAACEVAQRFHEEMRGYRQAEHKQVDADATEVNNCITLVGMWLTERAVSPAESVPISEHPDVVALRRQGHEQACRVTHSLMAERDELRQRAGAAHAEGRRSALEELAELKREKERRDRIVQRAVARLNAAEVEEPSVIGAGFADPALPIEELYPQWLKEKERADRAEAQLEIEKKWATDMQLKAVALTDKLAQQAPDYSPLFARIDEAIDNFYGQVSTAHLKLAEKGQHIADFHNEINHINLAEHADDIAVDRFAEAMKTKMAASRAKDRGGWDDPEQCEIEDLARMLVEHVAKGDPTDIGNFCMMIWNRVQFTGPDTYAPIVEALAAYRAAPQPSDNLQQASTAQVEPAKGPKFELSVMWGSYDQEGYWYPNPVLMMSEDQQRQQNEALGYECIKRPPQQVDMGDASK